MDVIVKITADHIANGEYNSLLRSPICLAIRDAVEEADAVEEHYERVLISMLDRDEFVECPLPPEAQDFAFGFDDGDKPGPLTFTLHIPDEGPQA